MARSVPVLGPAIADAGRIDARPSALPSARQRTALRLRHRQRAAKSDVGDGDAMMRVILMAAMPGDQLAVGALVAAAPDHSPHVRQVNCRDDRIGLWRR